MTAAEEKVQTRTPNEDAIVNYLAGGPRTAEEIEQKFGFVADFIQTLLERAQEKGRVTMIGDGQWMVTRG